MNNPQLKQTGKKNHTHESPNKMCSVNTISSTTITQTMRQLQYKRPARRCAPPHTLTTTPTTEHTQETGLQSHYRQGKDLLFCLENAIETALTEGIDFSNRVMAGTHHMVKSCRVLHRQSALEFRAFQQQLQHITNKTKWPLRMKGVTCSSNKRVFRQRNLTGI